MKYYELALTRASNEQTIYIALHTICARYIANETTNNTKIELVNGTSHVVTENMAQITDKIAALKVNI